MICPTCSSENPPGAAFCTRCGASLTGAGASQGTSPGAAPGAGETLGGVPYTTVPGSTSTGTGASGYTAAPGTAGAGSAYAGATGPTALPGALPGARPAGLSDNAAGAIAYITIIPAIVFLVLEPYNRSPFVRFHCFQSILLFVATVVVHILCGLIPVVGWMLAPLVTLAFLILWILCLIKASRGDWYKLPLIGNLAEQQARRQF